MSHVKKQTTDFVDLTCLEQAGDQLGMNFDRAAKLFKYYGVEQSKCTDGRFTVRGNAHAYEVGISKAKNGTYNLLYDSYGGGEGLMKVIGKDAVNLTNEYNAAVTIKTLSKQGMRCSRTTKADGSVLVVAE